MILAGNKLRKDDFINQRAQAMKLMNMQKKPMQYQMGVLLNNITKVVSVDDVEQALVLGRLTPEVSHKVYELFSAFGEENLDKVYHTAAEWILQDLGWDWAEIERIGEGTEEAWVDMMTQLTDTAFHNAVRDFDTNYRYRDIDAQELAPILHKAMRLNAPMITQVLNQYVTQREKLGKTRAKKNANRQISRKTVERAETLAIDAIGNSYMSIEREIVDQAINLGQMSPLSMKRWDTAKDGHVCGICTELEAIGLIPIDEDFIVRGQHFTGRSGAHSRCRCAVLYIDKAFIDAGIY